MKFLRIRSDVSRYQTLVVIKGEETERLWFSGREAASWQPPEVRVFNPLLERGNFIHLSPGILVFDQRTHDSMRDIFEMAGQILPIFVDQEKFYLLNVTQVVNSLNAEASDWRVDLQSGERISLRKYVFYPKFISESSLFKIPETVRAEVLAYSGVKDAGDEFWGRYTRLKLTGLLAEELYAT